MNYPSSFFFNAPDPFAEMLARLNSRRRSLGAPAFDPEAMARWQRQLAMDSRNRSLRPGDFGPAGVPTTGGFGALEPNDFGPSGVPKGYVATGGMVDNDFGPSGVPKGYVATGGFGYEDKVPARQTLPRRGASSYYVQAPLGEPQTNMYDRTGYGAAGDAQMRKQAQQAVLPQLGPAPVVGPAPQLGPMPGEQPPRPQISPTARQIAAASVQARAQISPVARQIAAASVQAPPAYAVNPLASTPVEQTAERWRPPQITYGPYDDGLGYAEADAARKMDPVAGREEMLRSGAMTKSRDADGNTWYKVRGKY